MKKIFLAIISILIPLNCFAMKIGVLADIHAGSKKTHKSGSSTTYPKKAMGYFETALKRMKAQGVELIVALGDNTEANGAKNFRSLQRLEKRYGIKVLWVRGNHDDDKNMTKVLGSTTYYYDKGDYRFIVLDTNLCPKNIGKSVGCLAQSQIDYLNANKTDRTIVLQHIPALDPITQEWRTAFEAERGMTVWSGHWHGSFEKDGQRTFPALTDHKNLLYTVIDL
jgi:predicted phosphodiesterase